MKTCIPCTGQSPDDASSCGNCGEASWATEPNAAKPRSPAVPLLAAAEVEPEPESAPIAAGEGDAPIASLTGDTPADDLSEQPSAGADDASTDTSATGADGAEQGELALSSDTPADAAKGGRRGGRGGRGNKPTGPLSN